MAFRQWHTAQIMDGVSDTYLIVTKLWGVQFARFDNTVKQHLIPFPADLNLIRKFAPGHMCPAATARLKHHNDARSSRAHAVTLQSVSQRFISH